jgi:hypothetical protein
MGLNDIIKDITIKEYTRAGIGILAVFIMTYYFWNRSEQQNKIIYAHQKQLEERVQRLEIDIRNCNDTKFDALRFQVDKSNQVIEKNSETLIQIKQIINK